MACARRGAQGEHETETTRGMNKIHRDLTTMVDGDDGARDETDMKVMIVTIKMRVLRMVIMIMTVTMIMILFRWPQFLDASQFFNRIRRGRTSILDPFTSSSRKDA